MLIVAKKLKEISFQEIIIVISNPVDVVTSLFQHYSGLPKEQVIGTGTLSDTARMKGAVSERFGIDVCSVYGYNLESMAILNLQSGVRWVLKVSLFHNLQIMESCQK